MKKNMLTKSLMSALLLTSTLAIAESDYPAADYQPKVLYSDPEYKGSAAPAEKNAAAAKPAPVEVEADPNFPATNFQPKVLYSDSNYKHDSTAPSAGSSGSKAAVSSSSDVGTASAVEEASASESGSSSTGLLGLLVLAAIGFFVYNKNSGSKAVSASGSTYADSNESTGVEKYLARAGINKTGVAKYIEKQGATNTTGVARYMAKQVIKDREAAAAKATGVEKYLRDKV